MPIKKAPQLYIGTSGWSYNHWKENFYPQGLSTKKWLGYYSEVFKTVEINNTYYHMPSEKAITTWHDTVNEQFVFSVKASRYITHLKRLKECEDSVLYLYERISGLKPHLGPVLFQLPPSFQMDLDRLKAFIKLLDKKVPSVFEFRHDTWYVDEVYNLLSKHNIALCVTDLNGIQSPEVVTADFTYIRLHGPKKAYSGSYGKKGIAEWKKKIDSWLKKISVYCYFDNDEKGYAVVDAKALQSFYLTE